MASNLREALKPLHFVTRLLLVQTFAMNSLRKSFWGILFAGSGIILYVYAQTMSPPPTSMYNANSNLQIIIIDYYNRYAMFASVLAIVTTSFFGQNKITTAIRYLEQSDEDFKVHFGVVVDNMGRCR